VEFAHTIAVAAARGCPVLQCQECAENIRKALVAAGLHGQFVELRTPSIRPFIVCLSYDGGNNSITQNGTHIGVRVGDLMFDNLHPDGMPYDDWVRDFDAWPGVVVSVLDDF
jgi:Papain fold toxin 2